MKKFLSVALSLMLMFTAVVGGNSALGEASIPSAKLKALQEIKKEQKSTSETIKEKANKLAKKAGKTISNGAKTVANFVKNNVALISSVAALVPTVGFGVLYRDGIMNYFNAIVKRLLNLKGTGTNSTKPQGEPVNDNTNSTDTQEKPSGEEYQGG